MNRSFFKNKNVDPSLNRENIDLESFLKDQTMTDIIEHENTKRNRLLEVASKCRSAFEQINNERLNKSHLKNCIFTVENECIKQDNQKNFKNNVMNLKLEDFAQNNKDDNHNKPKGVTDRLLEECEEELKLKVSLSN